MQYYLRIIARPDRNKKKPGIGCRLTTDNVKTAVKIHRLMNKNRILRNLSSDIFLRMYDLRGVIYKDGVYV